MLPKAFNPSRPKISFALLLFFLLVFCVYSNTFQSSWHLDDYGNIVNNKRLHLTDLSPQSLYKSFFAHPLHPGKLYRPVACLTLALNWYWGAGDVRGYHLVNMVIHVLTVIFLFLALLKLFESPHLKDKYQKQAYTISLLATLLWVLNPIHTQAVTYIVQRMAAMAAMFYILSIYFYVRARTNDVFMGRLWNYVGCGISFGLALGSKENAATLPLAIILVEFIFFQDLSQARTTKAFVGIITASAVIIFLAGVLFFLNGNPLSLLNYGSREFSPLQRLLTEPGIIIFYLSQIFYPVPTRLSIEHDVTIATSLWDPWYTLPSILIVVTLIGYGLAQMRKRPILSFAILFYFLNHIIESTVIGLELVFEHRNYLPSLFLFWPVAVACVKLLDYYRDHQPRMRFILLSFLICLLIGLGSATYIRNLAWQNERSLWEDAMQKAPGRARPAFNLARFYYKPSGQLDTALGLYEKALMLNSPSPNYTEALTYNAMAAIYNLKKDYKKVIALLNKSLSALPKFEAAQYNLVLVSAKVRDWDQATETVDLLISEHPRNSYYLYLKGALLNQQNQPEGALKYLRSALRINPKDKMIMAAIGQSFSMVGNYQRAEWFYRQAQRIAPRDIATYFCLIENRLNAGDVPNVARYTEALFATFSHKKIHTQLKVTSTNLFMPHYSLELLKPVISKKLEQIPGGIHQENPISEDGAHFDPNNEYFFDYSGNR